MGLLELFLFAREEIKALTGQSAWNVKRHIQCNSRVQLAYVILLRKMKNVTAIHILDVSSVI